jgi:RHH-type rel operon transcriptional repressor/antitoxin RelB
MAVSVRMDALLEKELELAAQRQGLTKSQFVINAVERALGRKNPYDLLVSLQAEEPKARYGEHAAEQPYDTVKSKAAVRNKLNAKHGVRRAG